MRRILKTHRAEADLEDIWLYSFEQWSEAQADQYYDQLIEGMNQLRDSPELGKSRETVRNGYRSLQIMRHIAYYQIEGQNIRITRVLHEKMSLEKNL